MRVGAQAGVFALASLVAIPESPSAEFEAGSRRSGGGTRAFTIRPGSTDRCESHFLGLLPRRIVDRFPRGIAEIGRTQDRTSSALRQNLQSF
jgi:hypothetical protein